MIFLFFFFSFSFLFFWSINTLLTCGLQMSEFGRRRSTFRRKPGPRSIVVVPRFRRRRRRRARKPAHIGDELKFYDQTLADTNIATNTDGSGIEADPSAVLLLNTVVQGDGESNRNGRKMIMKSIFVSGVVNIGPVADQTAAEAIPDIAIWLVLDMQTNGATIVSENVFVNKSAAVLGGTSVMRNLKFSTRYRILARRSSCYLHSVGD